MMRCKKENLYRDVSLNDALQKAITVLRGNIWRKTDYYSPNDQGRVFQSRVKVTQG